MLFMLLCLPLEQEEDGSAEGEEEDTEEDR